MTRAAVWTATCDVETASCVHTATMPNANALPTGWMEIGGTYSAEAGALAAPGIDVCLGCLTALPSQFVALIPTGGG